MGLSAPQAKKNEENGVPGPEIPHFSWLVGFILTLFRLLSQQLPETGVSTGEQLLSLSVSIMCLNSG